MSQQKNIKAWAKVLEKRQLIYPDERIVSFLAANYPDIDTNSSFKALDIGFSSGRHIALLRDYGFETYGIDYNAAAVDTVSRLYNEKTKNVNLQVADISNLPYTSEFFDVVICWGAIFYKTIDYIKKDLELIKNRMSKGGKMIINFRTKDNWFFGKGSAITEGITYELDASAGSYEGITYTFLDQDEITSVIQSVGFNIFNFERLDLFKNNAQEQHSWIICWLEKQ
ncbi:class I SAM-dependent methyltransferase [Paenibacillus lentus]|uniref:class I SAM-dependent methyltransferase n=1 Tax=Paenibacillus lentus TaxID=1338368 RepID=UPI00365381D7